MAQIHGVFFGGGLPGGILPESDYEDGAAEISRGDVIVVGTDGIWEAGNPDTGNMFGKQAMLHAVHDNLAGSAQNIGEAVMERLRLFGGLDEREDYLTLVVLKIGEEPSSTESASLSGVKQVCP